MSKKQENSLSLDREDLDAQLQAAADKQKKAKRKKKIRRIVIIAVIILIIVFIGIGILIATLLGKNKSATVQITHAIDEELTQEVKITGSVTSDNIQHFYSPTAIKVESCVPVGTFVKKGDPIIVFDSESYNNALKQLELSDKISDNSYQSTVSDMNDIQNKYWQACNDVTKYQGLVDEKQAVLDKFKNEETDEYKFLYINGPAQLAMEQVKQNALQESLTEINAVEQIMGFLTEEQQAQKNEIMAEIANSQTVYANVTRQINIYNDEISEASSKLMEYQQELATAKSKKESYSASLGNQYDKENRDLTGELNSIKTGSAYDELAKYTNGCLTAPFDGIVTGSYVSEGMTTSSVGAEIASFASIDDVSIDFSLNKKELAKVEVGQPVEIKVLDYEYKGTVERISRMANATSGGTSSIAAVISIDNPDDNIYLGLEAKCTITTGHNDSCLTVPSECINIDNDGYYIYTVDEMNIVRKNYVEMGLTSEDRTEIISGVTADDALVKIVTSDVIEGMPVVPVDADEMNNVMADMFGGMDVSVTVE